jgi:hypothetical protein
MGYPSIGGVARAQKRVHSSLTCYRKVAGVCRTTAVGSAHRLRPRLLWRAWGTRVDLWARERLEGRPAVSHISRKAGKIPHSYRVTGER